MRLVALAAAATATVVAVRRRRCRAAQDAKLAVLAGGGSNTATGGSSGGATPSELLKAMADAPADAGPLGRLATLDWQIDPADLEVVLGEDGAEVELGSGANGRVYKG